MPARTIGRTGSRRPPSRQAKAKKAQANPKAKWRDVILRLRGWIAIAPTEAVVVSTYLALTPPPAAQGPVPGEGEFKYGEILTQGPLQQAPTYDACTDDGRPTYGETCASLGAIFGPLLPVPADMVDVSDSVFRNAQGFITLDRIPATHWRNPEFYPGGSQTHFDDVYMTERPGIVTPIGFGAYPSITQVVTRQGTGTWTFSFFLKDGWDLTPWRGMVLDLYLPPTAMKANLDEPLLDDEGNPVTQDPAVAAGTNPRFAFGNGPAYESFSPDLLFLRESDHKRKVVLEPSYPSFRSGWVRTVTVEVDPAPQPPGTWFFVVKAEIPTQEIGELYFYEYGTFYQPRGFGLVLFQGLILVV